MNQVHYEGKAVVASGTREKCEADVARLHAYGLWATMQKRRLIVAFRPVKRRRRDGRVVVTLLAPERELLGQVVADTMTSSRLRRPAR